MTTKPFRLEAIEFAPQSSWLRFSWSHGPGVRESLLTSLMSSLHAGLDALVSVELLEEESNPDTAVEGILDRSFDLE